MYYLYKILIILFISLCATKLAFTKTVDIESTQTYLENETYYLDSFFNFSLTEEANKALHHGIPIEIHIHYQLRLIRTWLWDKTVSEKKIIYRLEHRPLANKFMVINLNTGLRSSYNDLAAALSHINSISRMKLFNHNILRKNKTYISRIKVFLDIDSLPSPMRPQAYFSSPWDIASEWHEWEVVQ